MSRLYYLAKQARYLLDTNDNWIDWAAGKGWEISYIHWKEQRQYEYDLMLELTRLGAEGITPAAKLIAIEMMKGNTNGFKS